MVEVKEGHPNLSAALVAALADLAVVEQTRTADMGTYSYKYAGLAEIVQAERKALAAHGLVALTPVHEYGNGLACSVILIHESGERLDFLPLPFPHGRDAQATGSMITYHRRYALTAALGISTGEDDDGAGAQARVAEPLIRDEVRQVFRSRIDALPEAGAAELREMWKVAGLPPLSHLRQSDEPELHDLLARVERKVRAEAEAAAAADAADDAPEASAPKDDPKAVPDEGTPPYVAPTSQGAAGTVAVASTEAPADGPETAAAEATPVAPPPFDADGLPPAQGLLEDRQWADRAPEGWQDEAVEEVKMLAASEVKLRLKASGLPQGGGDDTIRSKLAAHMVRRRMERALTP